MDKLKLASTSRKALPAWTAAILESFIPTMITLASGPWHMQVTASASMAELVAVYWKLVRSKALSQPDLMFVPTTSVSLATWQTLI